MKMEQTSIFDYLGYERDHLFLKIKKLAINESIIISSSTIKRENKGYEIENDSFHEAFLNAEECYKLLNQFINRIDES
jgi:hypothetical protein